MGAQCRWCVIGTGQFRLCQGRVDLTVADVMQQNGWAAFSAFEFGDEVVQTLRNVGWNGPVTERTNRIGH